MKKIANKLKAGDEVIVRWQVGDEYKYRHSVVRCITPEGFVNVDGTPYSPTGLCYGGFCLLSPDDPEVRAYEQNKRE